MPSADRAKTLRLADRSLATRNRLLADPVRLCKRLKQLRVSAGLTQHQVAIAMGYQLASAVYHMETGAHVPLLHNVAAYCTACGVEVSALFEEP